MTDIRQTSKYAEYLSKIGWIIEKVDGINYFIKKFPLIGSVIKIQRPRQFNNLTIQQLSDKYHAFQIIFEPKKMANDQWLMANGYKLSHSPYLPTKTLQLDLTKSEKGLLRGLKKDCRCALKKSMHYELCTMHSIKDFRNTWKRAVGLKRYVPPLSHLIAMKKSFGNNCAVYQCFKTLIQGTKEIEAGAIFLKADKTAYYWQAFTNKEGRKAQVQYKIVWEGILWAKKMGAKIFDFEGIYDDKFPNKSWLGFTHFKKSFGGHEISYPGTFVKTKFPFL